MTTLASLFAEIREALATGVDAVSARGLLARVVSALEHPTAEDVLALLRAHPEAAVSALKQLRIAGPWVAAAVGQNRIEQHHRYVVHGGIADEEFREDFPAGLVVAYPEQGVKWRIPFPDVATEMAPCASVEEGMRLVDARLRAEGWVLVDDRKEGA